MKRGICVFVASAFVLIGCASFTGVTPLYPKVGVPNDPSIVESLQPTFRWKPSAQSEVTYDFIVYEGIKEESLRELRVKRAIGREIYYREGLKETEHKIEEPLKPGTEYYWSVRIRKEQNVSTWSLYNYEAYLGVTWIKARNCPFIFETPKE
jgi:hypothetical protein